jgi:hypothetical protein
LDIFFKMNEVNELSSSPRYSMNFFPIQLLIEDSMTYMDSHKVVRGKEESQGWMDGTHIVLLASIPINRVSEQAIPTSHELEDFLESQEQRKW